MIVGSKINVMSEESVVRHVNMIQAECNAVLPRRSDSCMNNTERNRVIPNVNHVNRANLVVIIIMIEESVAQRMGSVVIKIAALQGDKKVR